VLPGLFVGGAVVAAGGGLVGAAVAVRVGVGAAVVARAVLAAAVGVGEMRTVSGVHARATTEVSANRAPSRWFRFLICPNSLSGSPRCRLE
jgi:hypothetical protein